METETWCVLLGAAAGFLKEAKLAGLAPLFSPSPPCLHTLSGGTASRLDRRPEPFLLFPKLGGHRLKIRGFENLANFDLRLPPGNRIPPPLTPSNRLPHPSTLY